MSEQSPKIRVSKLDAACRQLRTAITLWFTGGDPIAIHTLAFAAYEVLHHLSKKRDPFRRDLIFDTDHIKVEHLGDWNKLIRRHANFFKHADRDGDSVIEFDQSLNEFFMMFAALARGLCGEPQSDEESIFMWWLMIHKPHILTDHGRQNVAQAFPGDNFDEVRGLSKREFFEASIETRARARQGRTNFCRSFPLEIN
jgi:hypothetical protein